MELRLLLLGQIGALYGVHSLQSRTIKCPGDLNKAKIIQIKNINGFTGNTIT
jgi:hypothetical protein